jgi:glycosyltransferase involved in cell wall biosynthesis
MINEGESKKRVAVLASHPIEQQGPFFKILAESPGIDLSVFYCWKFGVGKPTFDPEFGKEIQWDIPLLDGYYYKFLKNISSNPTSARFWGETNPSIVSTLWRGKYDAVIVYGWSSATAWMAYFTALLRGTPIFIRGENPMNQEVLKGIWLRRVKKLILGWLFRYVTGFFYIGQENRQFYKYYGVPERKLHFVPYAVDNARFTADAERLSPQKDLLKSEFGISPDTVVILFLGKLIEKKRPMDLLKAYERIAAPNKALVFVGDGSLRPSLEGYVTENKLQNVHFMGFRNQTEIGKFYALADIFAFPSQAGDTWGFVLNEAMCFGLPLVVSNIVGSAPDLVHPGKNGFVFPMGNVDALTGVLEDLVANKEKRQAFGKESRNIVEGYSYEKDVEAIKQGLQFMSL